MFDERFDLAILSGPLALPGLTSGKAVLVVRLCDSRCLRGRFCPIAAIASWTFCFGQPELSGGASSWHRHCTIPQAAAWSSACLRVFRRHAGVDDGRPFA
ncbi:MAG: hypothetical protein GDA36_14110 [Rhodobacteraceae bacterium]|nr:hypothetical protein [Paracoccaceae bacterium]